MLNLPPGVTGREDYFGPDQEMDEVRYCGECDANTPHEIWRYGLREISECRECLHESERELGPDCE